MRVAFIIRFHYNQDDPRFEWRFNYFKNTVLPKIKDQCYKDFDICIRCNEWHKSRFEELGLKTFYIIDEVVKYKHSANGKTYFHDFVEWDRVVGLEKYDIQCGLDSDDLIHRNYLKEIIRQVEKHKHLGKSIHICYQPQIKELKTGRVTNMGKYSDTRGSAFMALYQPKNADYRFIYSESHISIIKRADIKVILPVGYCFASVHNFNESTGR